MGFTYSAKGATAGSTTTPTGWPSGWGAPDGVAIGGGGPWPPGWPAAPGGVGGGVGTEQLSVDSATCCNVDSAGDGSNVTLTCIVQDSGGSDTSTLAYHLIKVTAEISGSLRQLKKLSGDAFADAIYYQVTNYSGSHYGFSGTVIVDLENSDVTSTVTMRCEVVSVSPGASGSDTTLIAGCCDSDWCVSCGSCSGSYDIDLTITSTTQSGVLAVSKTIRPCTGGASGCESCASKVDSGARMRYRLTNNTSSCIHVQFGALITLPTRGLAVTKLNCGSSVGRSAGQQDYFFSCVEASPGTQVEGCLDARLSYDSGSGGSPADVCGQTGTILTNTYQVQAATTLSPSDCVGVLSGPC